MRIPEIVALLTVAVLMAVPSLQTPGAIAAQALPEAAPRGSIEGVVINAVDGAPFANVRVAVSSGAGRGAATVAAMTATTAITDASGRFIISNLPDGTYQIATEGFALMNPISSPGIRIEGGGDVRGLRLRVAALSAFSGRVVDADNNPVPAVQVRPFQFEYNDSGVPTLRPIVAGTFGGMTNENGEYRIYDARPGRYYLGIAGSATSSVVRAYYPGVVEFLQTVPVDLTSGVEIGGIHFRLPEASRYSVRFKLAGEAPAPCPPVTNLSDRNPGCQPILFQVRPIDPIELPYAFNSGSSPIFADADGMYTIPGLAPGSYHIAMSWPGPAAGREGPATGFERVEAHVRDEDVDLGTITVLPRATLAGTVTMPQGSAPLTSAGLAPLRAGTFALRGATAPVAADGTFSLNQVSAGRYMAVFNPPNASLYVSSIRYNGREVLGDGVTAESGTPGRLEITLDNRAGAVTGIVRNAADDPVPDSRVVLVPASELLGNPFLFVDATSDLNGRFSFSNVRPGDYRILAWDHLTGSPFRNVDWVRDYLPRAAEITVAPNGRAAADVRVLAAPGN